MDLLVTLREGRLSQSPAHFHPWVEMNVTLISLQSGNGFPLIWNERHSELGNLSGIPLDRAVPLSASQLLGRLWRIEFLRFHLWRIWRKKYRSQ
jgi:hypothetical protein